MTLAIRDPEAFYHPTSQSSFDEPSSSSTNTFNEHKARLPRLDELRLFTAGSDSGDLVERCLFTGRILVSPRSKSSVDVHAD